VSLDQRTYAEALVQLTWKKPRPLPDGATQDYAMGYA